jgi:hypothetical protein
MPRAASLPNLERRFPVSTFLIFLAVSFAGLFVIVHGVYDDVRGSVHRGSCHSFCWAER